MNRIERLRILLILFLGLLTVRLLHLQILRGAFYRRLAEQNRLRLVPEQAPRGLIVDRQGRVLATNRTVFHLALIPQELEDLPFVLSHVSSVVHRPSEELQTQFQQERTLPFIPVTIVSNVPKDVALRLEEESWQLPGLLVKSETLRAYPLGSTAAHLLGYLSQPTAEELPLLKQYGVRARQLVGRMGLERLLDQALRGQDGGILVEVNHRGRSVRVLGRRAPQSGARVVLTIDAQLQSLIEQAFETQPGACVILDPHTGEVLAMVSSPSFQPEAFMTGDADTVHGYLTDSRTPLMNRATNGSYQPGSIMKLVTAGTALERQIITPATTIDCEGSITIGDRVFHCWNRDGHGPMVLRDALMQSCNVYFMTVARRLGLESLRTGMMRMGLARRTGWLLEEQAGTLPQHHVMPGMVAMLGIGQGEVLITVLQSAVMAAVFANGGWLVEPWVIRSVGARSLVPSRPRHRIGWSTETIDAVRQGMIAVVRDPYGTGHRAYSSLISIAGKTGTAQTPMPGRTHGWFVGFCPVEQPRIAMAILWEYGGSGGDLPAEIARTICEYVKVTDTLSTQPENRRLPLVHEIAAPAHP